MTDLIIKKLVVEPKLLVTIPELPELISFPWKDHVMVKGSSPTWTLHIICADAPSSKISLAKAIEPNLGGTEKKRQKKKYF